MGKKAQTKTFRTRATRSSGKSNLLTSDPSQNTELLNNQLRALGLYAAPTLGDGNCLFRALSDQFYGSPSKHHVVRRDICDFIEANPERYEGFVDIDEFGDSGARKGKGGGLKAYVAGMRQNAVYGGHMELSAFAQLTQRNVKVIQPGLVYVIQYDPPPKASTSTTPATPKKKVKKEKSASPSTPSKSMAMAVDDSPSRHTRSSAKNQFDSEAALAGLNEREKRQRRREIQRKKEEEEAKRKKEEAAAEEADADASEDEEQDGGAEEMTVDEPQTSGPTIYVAYHDWEHFSSIRNLRGPHTGIPDVQEMPPPQQAADDSSSSSHTSNSPFSHTDSQTSYSSIGGDAAEDETNLSPAKARKRERERKEKEKKDRKIAKAKEKASSSKPSSSQAPASSASMNRFLKSDGEGDASGEAESSKPRSKAKTKGASSKPPSSKSKGKAAAQEVKVKEEPVDDVLPPASSESAPAPQRTGFKLRIPPRKSLASTPTSTPPVSTSTNKPAADAEIIDVESYPSPCSSPLTSESEDEPDEDVDMASPTKTVTSQPITAATATLPPSVATSPPESHSPSPTPTSSSNPNNHNPGNGVYLYPHAYPSTSSTPGASSSTTSNPYLNMNMNLSHPNLMSNPAVNGSTPVNMTQAQAQAYVAAMYSYAAAAAAAGYSPYGQQYPYSYPAYGYGYGYGYPNPNPNASTSSPNAEGSQTQTQTPSGSSPNVNSNPYLQGHGYPFPFAPVQASGQSQTQTQPQPQSQPTQPPSHITHLTHLNTSSRTQRSPKRSFEESFSDDVSDLEKDRGAKEESGASSSKDIMCSTSPPGSGSESDYKRSRIDSAGARGNKSREDLTASAGSGLTTEVPSTSSTPPAVGDEDAEGDTDPGHDTDEEEEEREVERKLSPSTLDEDEDEEDEEEDDYEDVDDGLEPNLNRLQPPSTTSKKAQGSRAAGRPLTRRERKKLGLPKPRATPAASTGSVGKIVIPGGKRSQGGGEIGNGEWLMNGAGRVDVRGFRELKI